jgi:ABC-type transport system substrate-binding protein
MALDRRRSCDKIAHGLGDLTDTALSPRSRGRWTTDTAHYDYDPAKAKALLDADGLESLGPDGIRVKNGNASPSTYSTQTESATGKAIET